MTTTVYGVAGMTCGHCVNAVTAEVSRLPGVRDVQVQLQPEGETRVTVTSDGAPGLEAVRLAVDEAGYRLTGVLA